MVSFAVLVGWGRSWRCSEGKRGSCVCVCQCVCVRGVSWLQRHTASLHVPNLWPATGQTKRWCLAQPITKECGSVSPALLTRLVPALSSFSINHKPYPLYWGRGGGEWVITNQTWGNCRQGEELSCKGMGQCWEAVGYSWKRQAELSCDWKWEKGGSMAPWGTTVWHLPNTRPHTEMNPADSIWQQRNET